MAKTTLRAKGQVTIPTKIREAARLKEGDPIEVEMTRDGILLRPAKVIDATQAWFWMPEWQAGEREASADIRAGRLTVYESAEDFLAALSKGGRKPKGRAGAKRTRRG
jgi:AbrB family looped-hinge helix DNA binding protein